MTESDKQKLALDTYELGIKMGSVFAKNPQSKEFMVFAIAACISGLTNMNDSLMFVPEIEYDGAYFKDLRISKGLTLRQTEDATGISNSYLSQLENNKIANPSHRLVKILTNWYLNGTAVPKSEFNGQGFNFDNNPPIV